MINVKTFALGIMIISIGVIGFIILTKTKPQPKIVEPSSTVWRIYTQSVKVTTATPEYNGFGTVENPGTQVFKARITADVDKIYVREGQRVEKGALLASLQRGEAEIKLVKSEADLADATSKLFSLNTTETKDRAALSLDQEALNLYEQRLARANDLKIQDLASDQTLEEARQAVVAQKLKINRRELALELVSVKRKQLQTLVQLFEAEVRAAKQNFDSTTIKANRDGQIDKVHVVPGDRVQANQDLITFAPEFGREIRIPIPLIVGNQLSEALEVETPIFATTKKGHRLKLARVSGALRLQTGTLDAFFTSDDRLPVTGTVMPISIDLLPEDKVITLPTDALYGDNTIYRITVDSRLDGISVERIGQRTNKGKTEVLLRAQELSTGDAILISRLPSAITGLKVEVIQ